MLQDYLTDKVSAVGLKGSSEQEGPMVQIQLGFGPFSVSFLQVLQFPCTKNMYISSNDRKWLDGWMLV